MGGSEDREGVVELAVLTGLRVEVRLECMACRRVSDPLDARTKPPPQLERCVCVGCGARGMAKYRQDVIRWSAWPRGKEQPAQAADGETGAVAEESYAGCEW